MPQFSVSHGRCILRERAIKKFDKYALRIAIVLTVIAVMGIGFCVAYGINISDASTI